MMTKKLTDIKTPRELASFLGIQYQKHLIYHIYRVPAERRYMNFEIPKRSGGTRIISSPATHLKTIQRHLAKKLAEIYVPQNPAHGFVLSKSIITNADQHISRRYVLNIDLVDFFGTINFGRVRGLFMAQPYNLPEKLATVIAQICCNNNALPQGAPTSPIVSNMLCSKMDSDLRKLAKKFRCRYTRYADDITFSTNSREFSRAIAYSKIHGTEGKELVIGQELQHIIEKNGFQINLSKTRLQSRSDRQEVTGLITNKKRNISRTFIRTTRAMLHSWSEEQLETATKKHYEKNRSHYIPDFKSAPDIQKIVRGRLEFIKSIRGIGFSAYITLAKKYNELKETSIKKLPVPSDSFLDLINQNVFVIQNSRDIVGGMRMGTAFYLEDVGGFVTCDHVLDKDTNPDVIDDCNDFWLIHPKEPSKPYPLKIRIRSGDPFDIAIFDLQDPDGFFADHRDHKPLKLRRPFVPPKTNDVISLVGWPKFTPGDSIAIKKGRIYATNVKSAINRFYITEQIIEGNSGGPVLDNLNNVIGIAARGNNNRNASEVAEHIAISANHVMMILGRE